MITETLIWFVDCRTYYRTTSLDKIVHLANMHQKRLKVIFDASAQLKGRGYWYLFDDKDALSKAALAEITKKEAQLLAFFDMNAIKADITINQSTDYLQMLNKEINNNQCIVAIEDNMVAKRHSIFQQLTDINTSVLVLSKKVWKKPFALLAAIDPLHEHARPEKIDENIASLAKNWALSLEGEWTIGHCCYVESIASEYKKKVLSIHRDALTEFAQTYRLSSNHCVLLKGVPEKALATYVAEQCIDVLIMGLVTRNKLQKMWVGSTSTALLSVPPCDLLFIKK